MINLPYENKSNNDNFDGSFYEGPRLYILYKNLNKP